MTIEKAYQTFDFAIIVAMECMIIDPRQAWKSCSASGTFYNESTQVMYKMEAKMDSLEGSFSINACSGVAISSVSVYGSIIRPATVWINEHQVNIETNVRYDEDNQRLDVTNITHMPDICQDTADDEFLMRWTSTN